MVVVLTHILHQPTRYTIFHNDKLCGFNSLKKKQKKKNCSVVTKNAFKILVGNIGFSLSLQDLNMGMEI